MLHSHMRNEEQEEEIIQLFPIIHIQKQNEKTIKKKFQKRNQKSKTSNLGD